MRKSLSINLFALALLLTMLSAGLGSAPHSPAQAQGGFDCSTVTDIPESECEALVALYEATDGDNWTHNTNWLVTNTPCTWPSRWHGVTCLGSTNVTRLSLGGNQLGGPIPPQIGNLSALEWLLLRNNQLSGPIPPQIGSLSALTWLDLGGNQLSGPIPPEIGNLSALTQLSLGSNQLSGTIPPQIANLSALTLLFLYNNQLSGTIPPEIGNLSALTTLSLDRNQLSGTIPADIGTLSALVVLYLHQNQLSGTIPPEIGNLSTLTWLHLHNNQLSGPIPPQIGSLSALTWLRLSRNQLSGPIPPEIGNLSALTGLSLGSNQLSGTIPPEIGNLSALTGLSLNNNQLSGPIPPQIGSLTTLTELFLARNQLSGPIPPQIGNLSALMRLSLNNNQLSGELPVALTHLNELLGFHFNNTDLCVPPSGPVPEWLNRIPDVRGTGLICPGNSTHVPYFSQRDPDWIDHPLRTDGVCSAACDTIGKCGCCLTSAAMVFNYYGSDRTPASLSDCMDVWACPFYWLVGKGCSQGHADWQGRYSFSWNRLEALLRQQPVLVQMTRGPREQHWVLVLSGTGGDPANYTMHDPWPLNGAAMKLNAYSVAGWKFAGLAVYAGQPVGASAVSTQRALPSPPPVVAPVRQAAGQEDVVTVAEAQRITASSVVTGSALLYRMTDVTMTVQLTATSAVGDVVQMLLWTDSMTETTWQPFATHAQLSASEFIYARFRDTADNVSATAEETRFTVQGPPSTPWEAVGGATIPSTHFGLLGHGVTLAGAVLACVSLVWVWLKRVRSGL